jgi:L-asparaginase
MSGQALTEPVCVVSTGGTFEKVYDPISERMTFSGISCVPTIFRQCMAGATDFKQIMQVDSLVMDDDQRNDLFKYVTSLDYRKVVIIHGTSSLLLTARMFQDANLDAVYVFTGAMTPFSHSQTEASFNLGGAIALARCLEHGVLLYMHGEIFDPTFCEKDTTRARFVHRR